SRCVPLRSRTKTHRTATSGRPLLYHRPPPVTTSTRRRPPPYQATLSTGGLGVSWTTWAGLGSSFPFLPGRWAGRFPPTRGRRPPAHRRRRRPERVGRGVELADERLPPVMRRGPLGQFVRRVIAVGAADEPPVRAPADQDAEHLPQQVHRGLVRPPRDAIDPLL